MSEVANGKETSPGPEREKRIHIGIPLSFHRSLKVHVSQRDGTLTDFFLAALKEKLERESEPSPALP